MRLFALRAGVAAIAVAMLVLNAAQADILIDSSTGNGDFQEGGTAVGVNGGSVTSTNANGRALGQFGSTQGGSFADIGTITDNAGIEFDGWGVYRRFYQNGNNAMGLLENGGRLGKANEADNGQVFANSSDYFLLSDVFAAPAGAGNAGDVFDFSILAGTDIGGGLFDLDIYLVFDGGPAGTLVQSNTGQTTAVSTFSGQFTTTAAYSTVQLGFEVDAAQAADNGGVSTRVLLDDAFLEVTAVAIPEPSSLAIFALAGLGLVGYRRRS